MMTFITEVRIKTPEFYGFREGPRISASSWAEAEAKATKQGVILVGEVLD